MYGCIYNAIIFNTFSRFTKLPEILTCIEANSFKTAKCVAKQKIPDSLRTNRQTVTCFDYIVIEHPRISNCYQPLIFIPVTIFLGRFRTTSLFRHDDLIDAQYRARSGSGELDTPVLGDEEVKDTALGRVADGSTVAENVEAGRFLALVMCCLQLGDNLWSTVKTQ